jgi:hypothetical protein
MFEPYSIPFWTALAALAGSAQVLVLVVTAAFVWSYLRETTRLRRAAETQIEAQMRPALEVVVNIAAAEMWLQNLGTGPALGLRLSRLLSNTDVDWNADDVGDPLAQSFVEAGKRSMSSMGTLGFGPEVCLQVLYTSLSGREYATVVDFPQPGVGGRTRFIVKKTP